MWWREQIIFRKSTYFQIFIGYYIYYKNGFLNQDYTVSGRWSLKNKYLFDSHSKICSTVYNEKERGVYGVEG